MIHYRVQPAVSVPDIVRYAWTLWLPAGDAVSFPGDDTQSTAELCEVPHRSLYVLNFKST
jgi:hypothetical protein